MPSSSRSTAPVSRSDGARVRAGGCARSAAPTPGSRKKSRTSTPNTTVTAPETKNP